MATCRAPWKELSSQQELAVAKQAMPAQTDLRLAGQGKQGGGERHGRTPREAGECLLNGGAGGVGLLEKHQVLAAGDDALDEHRRRAFRIAGTTRLACGEWGMQAKTGEGWVVVSGGCRPRRVRGGLWSVEECTPRWVRECCRRGCSSACAVFLDPLLVLERDIGALLSAADATALRRLWGNEVRALHLEHLEPAKEGGGGAALGNHRRPSTFTALGCWPCRRPGAPRRGMKGGGGGGECGRDTRHARPAGIAAMDNAFGAEGASSAAPSPLTCRAPWCMSPAAPSRAAATPVAHLDTCLRISSALGMRRSKNLRLTA
eukprot:scaffold1223_cov136-Isochrysis_galbana.AAC.8